MTKSPPEAAADALALRVSAREAIRASAALDAAARPPVGSVTIVLDVPGAGAFTAAVGLPDSADFIGRRRAFHPARPVAARSGRGARPAGSRRPGARPEDRAGLARRAAALALGRPGSGATLRGLLAAEIQREGRAVLTIHIPSRGFAAAVGPWFVDIAAAAAAAAPPGKPASLFTIELPPLQGSKNGTE